MSNAPSLHIIVFKTYELLQDISKKWSALCEKMAVAEHPAEGKTKRIHCHMLLINPQFKENSFRESLKKEFPGISGRKDFRIFEKTQETKEPISPAGLRYLLKGETSRLKFEKLFSKQEVDEAVVSWVTFPTETKPKSDKTDWDIINDMKKDLYEQKIIKERLFTQDDNRFTSDYIVEMTRRTDFIKVINKHLRINKKKTSIHDIERWIVTIMREDTTQPFWDKIFSKLDI